MKKNTTPQTAEFLTPAEAFNAHNDGQNQNIKSRFVEREIYCNVGSLVEHILKTSGEDSDSPVSYEQIENFYSYPEYKGEHADFEGGTDDERRAEIERLQDLRDSEQAIIDEIESTEGHARAGDLDTLQTLVNSIEDEIEELENLEQEAAEIFEWWAVSSFMFEDLKKRGYPCIDAGSLYIWGRTTTGQAILLDGIIGRICADMEILEGQRNSWAK